jgi:preprotein translocase subunit YajC
LDVFYYSVTIEHQLSCIALIGNSANRFSTFSKELSVTAAISLLAMGSGQGQPGGGGMDYSFFIVIILMFAILYFLIMRPQQKEQQRVREMLKNLKKGDDVVTVGGIFGKIIDIDDTTVDLKIAEGTKIKIERGRIGKVVTKA